MRTFSPKTRIVAFLLALAVCFFCLPGPALAAQAEGDGGTRKTLRVGFPLQAGLTEVSENGRLSGYTYEFLLEIAQYTGWEYEFVQIPGDVDTVLTEMLAMLERGDLDLMGGMVYNDALAEKYDYPGYSYGTSYMTLCVLAENTAINETSFPAQKGLRIAVRSHSEQTNAALLRYCESNGMTVELVPFDTSTELQDALRDGLADVIVSNDLNDEPGMRVVAKFLPRPFYFATTKGNSDIVGQLNSAIFRISEADPYFTASLYEKYFNRDAAQLFLSDEEAAYIASSEPLRVALTANKAPFQFHDPDTGELRGISVEVLDELASMTGLRFELVPYETTSEFYSALARGETDLAAGIPYRYDDNASYAMTRPYATSQVTMVLNQQVDPEQLAGKRLALPYDFWYDGLLAGETTWYDSVADCIAAVDGGDADYSYANGFSAQYYANLSQYQNISLIPQSGLERQICLGVTQPVNSTLLSILNKAIRCIPESELQSILYRNTSPKQAPVTLTTFIDSNPRQALLVFAIAMGLLVVLLLLFFYVRIRAGRKSAVENERYALLCELSNEFLYEYDFNKDRLTVSGRSSAQFDGERTRERFLERIRSGETVRESDRQFAEHILSGESGSFEFRYVRMDGGEVWVRILLKTVRDTDGNPIYSIGKIVDIQRERAAMASLLEQAQKDGLTGVYNAVTIRRLIAEQLAQDNARGVLFLTDIDRFKGINDRFGHYTGDQVLVLVADALKAVFPDSALLGRVGGDEFLAYLPDAGAAEAAEACVRLAAEIERASHDMEADVTLSIGAAWTDGPLEMSGLYQSADQALYAVKNRGRNGYEVIPAHGAVPSGKGTGE